MYKQCRW